MEKTEKELLELAAKAAGYKIIFTEPVEECVRIDGYRDDDWNPLKDDGDALRLAVILKMSVEISEHEQATYAYAGYVPRVWACESWRDDREAATRRAIVRAAAEIGKAMP